MRKIIATVIVLIFFLPVYKTHAVFLHSAGDNFKIPAFASAPVVTIGPVTGKIITCQGVPSVAPDIQQVNISGSNLKSDIYVSPPQGFEVSLSPNSGYTNSLTIPAVNKSGNLSVPQVTMYIRASAGAQPGKISGNIIVNTTGANDKNVAVSGIVYASPSINTVQGQTVKGGQATAPVNFTGNGSSYIWTNDTPGIGLPASGTGNILSFNAVNTGNDPVVATIEVTPVSSNNCNGTPTLFTIMVNSSSSPGITAGSATGIITACAGSPSQSPNIQQFFVEGEALNGNISATAPAGFELSLTPNSGFSNGIVIDQTAGKVNPVTVFVRASPSAPAGSISGKVILTSPGVASKSVNVKGIINTLPTVTASLPSQTVVNGSATTAINFSGPRKTYTWVNNTPGIGLAASGEGNIGSFTAINAGNTSITATITVIPQSPEYAYIANQTDGTVSVINTVTYKTESIVKVGNQPIGVAVGPDGRLVYVTNTGSNNVSVINTSTNAVTSIISVGKSPQGVAVSPDGSMVYVANGGDNTVSVINTLNNTKSIIKVGINPFGVVVSPDGRRAYVTNTSDNTVSIINTANNAVISIAAGVTPQGIAVTPDGSRLYIVNTNFGSVTVINTATGLIIAKIATGSFANVPSGVVVSPDGSKVYAAGYLTGDIYVINTANNVAESLIKFPSGITGVSLNQDGSRLYVEESSNNNTLSVVNTATNTIIGVVRTGNVPVGIGNFVTGSGCSGAPVIVTIKVNPSAPGIQAIAAIGNIFACAGTPSARIHIQQFTVSGNGLTGDITAVAPADFEISLSPGSGYGGSVTLKQAGGLVGSTIVYARSSASAPAGNITGDVLLSSTGVGTMKVSVNGIVNQLAVASANPVRQEVVNGSATVPVNFTGTGNTFTWVNNNPGVGLPASGTGDVPSFKAINNGSTPITATLTVTSSSSAYAYIGNTTGPVTVLNTTTNKVATTINTGSPLCIVVSPDNSRAYVANFASGSISVVAVATNAIAAIINIGVVPEYLAISPDGNMLYVTTNANTVLAISTKNYSTVATISTGLTPFGIIVSPDGKRVYVANIGENTVSVISTATNTIIHSITVDQGPNNVLLSPDGSKLYITYGASSTVAVINTVTYAQLALFTVGLAPFYADLNPDGSLLYVSTAEGIWKFNTLNYTLDNVLEFTPTGLSFTADGRKLYAMDSFSNQVVIFDTATDAITQRIPVTRAYTYGSFVTQQVACDGPPVNFTIQVDPSPPVSISVTGTLTDLTTTYGTPSASAKLNITGNNLQAGIKITVPAGFEISADNISFNSVVTIGAAGKVTNAPVYIRLAAVAPVGNYAGKVVVSSAGAQNDNSKTVNGNVKPAPLTIKADDKTKVFKTVDPVLTATYTGFVNNESAVQLTTQPLITTTATISSPVGKYPITVEGASAVNYAIRYIQGVFTITPIILPLIIPNTITPNGDGINDFWLIKNIEDYPDCTVAIYDRWGQQIYTSVGYAIPWDGRYKGENLPTGTYYYIINLEKGSSPIGGYVAIVR